MIPTRILRLAWAIAFMIALCGIGGQVEAAIVTQLDITGGTIDLDFGSRGHVAGSFTQNGLLVMGQYQPPPNVFPPIQVSHLTFSIFTSATPGGFPVPTGQTTGSTKTVELRSLAAGLSSSQWSSWMTPALFANLNIGGNASGSFYSSTSAFDISWNHAFSGIPFLTTGTFTLQGTAQVAAVPLPAAAILFGTGLGGLALTRGRRMQSPA